MKLNLVLLRGDQMCIRAVAPDSVRPEWEVTLISITDNIIDRLRDENTTLTTSAITTRKIFRILCVVVQDKKLFWGECG